MQHKQTRELYALKYINKTKCVKMKAVANIIQERRLLEEVGSVSSDALAPYLTEAPRSTTPLSSTCGMPSRTTRTVSSCWISCWEATFDVRIS